MISPRFAIVWILLIAPQLAAAQEPRVLKQDGWIAAVVFSPDSKTLASAGADNVVRLWEVGTWKLKGALKGHGDCVCTVAFSKDGDWLACGSFDRTGKMWDVHKQQALHDFSYPNDSRRKRDGAILTTAIHPSKEILVSAGVDSWIVLHDIRLDRDKSADIVLPGHKSWVNSIAFNREGNLLASGSSDATVRLWKIAAAMSTIPLKEQTILEGGAGEVRCVAFSPDGKILAAGNRYGTVRVWDVGPRKEVATLAGHASDVWAIAFSPDGKTLAAADTDWKKPSKIKLWDTTTWKERGSLSSPGEILCLAYSPKGDWLAAGSWDKTVRLFALQR
jgi:WD40 repeat protein